jgi:hypothetical protein
LPADSPDPLAAEHILHVTSPIAGPAAAVVEAALERAREAGLDASWMTVGSDGRFVPVVESLIARLRGGVGGGIELREGERLTYESVLQCGAGMVRETVPCADLVALHDPATAGLCAPLKRDGARVAWVCHVAIRNLGGRARGAWEFLAPHLDAADALVFLRAGQIPPHREGQRVIAASLDLLQSGNEQVWPTALDGLLGDGSPARSSPLGRS